MRRAVSFLFLAVLLVPPRVVSGQESQLVVIDDNGARVGDLLQLHEDGGSSDLMLYRYGASDYVVLLVSSDGLTASMVMFADSACSGQAWVVPGSYALLAPHPFGVVRNGTLFRVEPNTDHEPAIAAEYLLSDTGSCSLWSPPPGFNAVRAAPVGPMPTWTAPFTYQLNPSIFWDQFQTGDSSRWTNY